MHCTYCGLPKGISQAKAMPNSEIIKLIALAIIKLCLSEGISRAVSQLEENLVKILQLFVRILGQSEACLGLVLSNNTAPSSSGKN